MLPEALLFVMNPPHSSGTLNRKSLINVNVKPWNSHPAHVYSEKAMRTTQAQKGSTPLIAASTIKRLQDASLRIEAHARDQVTRFTCDQVYLLSHLLGRRGSFGGSFGRPVGRQRLRERFLWFFYAEERSFVAFRFLISKYRAESLLFGCLGLETI